MATSVSLIVKIMTKYVTEKKLDEIVITLAGLIISAALYVSLWHLWMRGDTSISRFTQSHTNPLKFSIRFVSRVCSVCQIKK